jgi:hypothetical protein
MSLLKHYRTMAATGQAFRGLTLLQSADAIGELIRQTGSISLLDYGSGAGEAYEKPHRVHKTWGVDRPRLYDPAFKKFAVKPSGTYHGVICSDVLEHVPESACPELVATLFGYAERFVFASFCNRPAKKTFPNGTNLHVTQRPREWWTALFDAEQAKRPAVRYELVETP